MLFCNNVAGTTLVVLEALEKLCLRAADQEGAGPVYTTLYLTELESCVRDKSAFLYHCATVKQQQQKRQNDMATEQYTLLTGLACTQLPDMC